MIKISYKIKNNVKKLCYKNNKLIVILQILFCFIVLSVLYFHSPAENSFFPKCIFYKFTSLYCPGCGTSRALYYVLHGDFLKALKYNALFILLLPLIIYIFISYLLNLFFENKVKINLSPKTIIILLIITIVFFVLRNLKFDVFNILKPDYNFIY